jgi:hypothetical protein
MCFSMAFFFSLMIWLVVVGAIYAIIRLVVPAVLANFGGPGSLLAQVVNIILWAGLLIVVLYLIWTLVECLLGAAGGLHLPGR